MPWLASMPWPWRYMIPSIVWRWGWCSWVLASWVDAKELDFGLIWRQNVHPVLLWIIGTLQTGLYMCFLEQGTLQVLQDFSPSRRSVLPIVFSVTMVSAALRSLTRSSRIVLGWFLSVLMIIETPRGEVPQFKRDWGILCFFHLRIIAQTIVTLLTELLGDGLVAHSSLV